MREEDGGARYMSPLVKQDLAKLEKDGESRRVALHALKQFVENLEPSSVPRFLAQVSESKDTGGSRSYAISLYEEVARVHGKLIIPQIGRVMATVTRSLSGSGSSPQLHQACAKVVAALVRYSIDADFSAAEAEDILKEVSRPLVDLLAGKLEHVAAGAATCMQALVESEKWKHAPADLVSEVCHRTTTALGDNSTRTVAHMQLARSLATMNPGTLNVYGACLLHAAEEVLSSSTCSWQHRKCAARMAQAVLAIVDRETLALEFHAITQVLENCKHDRMPHVRTAVCEALQAAKMFMNGETIKEEHDEDHQGSGFVNPTQESPQRRKWSSKKYSPSSQDTYNLSSYTPPPTASDSATSDPFSTPGSTGRMKRSLLFPSKTDSHSPFVSAPLGLTSYQDSMGLNSYHNSGTAEDSARSSVSGGSTVDSGGGVSGYYDPAPPCQNKLVCDEETEGLQHEDKESLDEKDFTPGTVTQDHPKGKVESRFSPFEALITRSFGEAEGDLMAEDEEILSRGAAEFSVYGKNGASIGGNPRLSSAVGQFRQETQTPQSMADSECVQSNSISYRGMDSGHSDANDCALPGKKGFGSNSMTEKVVDVLDSKLISHMGSSQGLPIGKPNVHELDAGISHAQYMKLVNLCNNPEDGFSALKPRVLITTADFLPYTTPRRLVLSLQSQLPSVGNEGDEVGDEDVVRRIDDGQGERAESSEDAVRRIDDGAGKRIEFNEEADMDVESSSDSVWSIRDNPVASDESVTEESEEEVEERHTEIHETFALPRKLQGVGGLPSRRNAVSPPRQQRKFLDLDDDSDHSKVPENVEYGSPEMEASTLTHQTPNPLGTPARSPGSDSACTSCTESQRNRSAMKAQEWDLGMDVNSTADHHRPGTRRSVLFAQEPEASTDTSQGSKASVNDPTDAAVCATEDEPRGWWSNSSLVRSAKTSCSRITPVAEAVLGGSLCLVIAVPVTMVLARLLQTPQDYFLVPT